MTKRAHIRRVLAHDGGRILVIGVMWTFFIAVLAATIWVTDPDRFARLLPALVAEASFGKEASIPAAFAAGESLWVAVAIVIAWDWIILFTGFGLILLVRDGIAVIPSISKWLEKRRASASGTGRLPHRAGVAGLALAVWIPFSPTGALTAGVIGTLLGYRPRILLPALVASTIGVAIIYAALAARVFDMTGRPPVWAGWVIALASLALVAVATAIGTIRARRAQE